MEHCEHGYPIPDPDKLPHKRTSSRIEVCDKCALKSSLRQLGSGIVLSPELADELRRKLNGPHK